MIFIQIQPIATCRYSIYFTAKTATVKSGKSNANFPSAPLITSFSVHILVSFFGLFSENGEGALKVVSLPLITLSSGTSKVTVVVVPL